MRQRHATAVLVDMRDFTPTFNEHREARREADFLRMVDSFYGACADACRETYDGDPGDDLYLGSTGDGVLAVFQQDEHGAAHTLRAYLACLLMLERLPAVFGVTRSDRPRFGIGMEMGCVTAVGPATGPRTVLGHCINVAARLEGLTKVFASTSFVLGAEANRVLVSALLGEDYEAMMREAIEATLDASEVGRLWARLRAANDALGLIWMGSVQLKGVRDPLPAFRGAPTLLQRDPEGRRARVCEALAR
jgi:class 3 adenylate cyclase